MGRDVSLVTPGGFHEIGIKVIAAIFSHSLQLHTRMFERPDVVISVLGSLLDPCNLYASLVLIRLLRLWRRDTVRHLP